MKPNTLEANLTHTIQPICFKTHQELEHIKAQLLLKLEPERIHREQLSIQAIRKQLEQL